MNLCLTVDSKEHFYTKNITRNDMKDLYTPNKLNKLEEVNKQLQNYLEICYLCPKNGDKIDISAYEETDTIIQNYLEVKKKGIQAKINKHTNLQAFINHKTNHAATFVETINNLFEKHIIHLDTSEKAFLSSFADNYQKNVFELVIAEFSSNNFTLLPRPEKELSPLISEPDLAFTHNEKTYFLESTTRNSSLMDKFAEHLYEFDLYLEAAQILQNCQTGLREQKEFGWGADWSIMAEPLWYRLDITSQQRVSNLIKKTAAYAKKDAISPARPLDYIQIIHLISNWADLNLYAWFYFRNILPPILIQKMAPIMPRCMSCDMAEFSQFLVKSVVTMIVRKLECAYFQKKTPVILALSLSTLPDFMSTAMAFNQFGQIAASISNELRTNITTYVTDKNKIEDEESIKEKIKIISENIKSLYAVIIDTTWYNWFPDVAENLQQARWADEVRNCYIAIYNTQTSPTLNCDHHILSFIPNQIDLPLVINFAE